MKKIISIIWLIILVLPFANAQEVITDPGVTPDSLLWGIDKALDQITLILARSPEAKAAKGLEIAQERLLEVKAMAEENKLEALAKAEDAHSKTLIKIKQNIQSIEETDPEVQIEKEIDIEKKLKNHEDNIKKVREELKVKIKIEGQLTEEQQARLDEFLKSLENNVNKVEIEVKNKKDKTKIKIKEKTGKSDEEIEEDIEVLEIEKGILEEELEVEAKIVGEKSFIKVEKEFETKTTDRSALIDEIIKKFSLDFDQVNSLFGVEIEDEEELKDQLRIEAEIEDGLSKVEIKLEFSLDSVDRNAIINAIVDRTKLTRSNVEDVLEFEIEKGDDLKSEDEVECVVDADCKEDEFCDEGECEDLEELEEEDREDDLENVDEDNNNRERRR